MLKHFDPAAVRLTFFEAPLSAISRHIADRPDSDKDVLLAEVRRQGFPELLVPKVVLMVAAIPVLESGKVDLRAALEWGRDMRPLL